MVAERASGVSAVPESAVCGPGGATVTVLSTVQGNGLVCPEALEESVAVTTTDDGVRLPVVGVPVITPVVGSMDRPAGSPLAP